MEYRFIIAVDIDGESLDDAYKKLRAGMAPSPLTNEWESTDEAYGPGGEPIRKGELEDMRVRVIQAEGEALEVDDG